MTEHHASLVTLPSSEISLEPSALASVVTTSSTMRTRQENASDATLNVSPALSHPLPAPAVMPPRTELPESTTLDTRLVSANPVSTPLPMAHASSLTAMPILSALNAKRDSTCAFNVWLLETELSSYLSQSVFAAMVSLPTPATSALPALQAVVSALVPPDVLLA